MTKIDIKKIINKILNSYVITIIFGILLFGKAMMFYKNTIALTEKLEFSTIFGTVGFISALVCFLSILPNRARTITTTIVNLLISILLFSDNIYYVFSSNVLSVAQISNLQYSDQISATLPSLLEMKYILYFVDIILFLILLISKVVKIEKKERANKKQNIARVVTGVIGIIIFVLVCVEYIENVKGTQENSNIIIVQLESIQDFVINKKINGKEITPNLNKFLSENIRFTNMHMQSYSTTADSEHSMITSTYPMENGMSFSRYYTNNYDDIFKLYNNANYYTAYMHGNYPYFWNRGNVYGRLNLNKLEFVEDFKDVSERINGDLSDELLYIQAVDKMKQYENPFMANVVSASSHTPFTLEGIQDRERKVSIDVGKYKDTYFGNYLEAVNYADYAFGIFVEKLKEADLYDNTTILIYGDHNGLTMYDEEMVDFLKQINSNITDVDIKLNYTRVAAGLKLSNPQKAVISKPVNKLDIKPTLSYLFNLEDGISLGTNMFESKDFVSLNNERIITDKYYYDEQWYDIITGNEINIDNLNEEEKAKLENYYKNMKTELDLSISISINDLINKRD